MHEAAIARTGLQDFGATDYLAGLEILLPSLDDEASLSPEGRDGMRTLLVGLLAARLMAVQGLAQRPDLACAPVSKPVFITGIPRTGTTALQRLLAVDPQFQGLEQWLTSYPMPRPPRETWDRIPFVERAARELERQYAASPGLKQRHLHIATEVDECFLLLRQTFTSNYFGATKHVPTYDSWWRRQDEGPSYRWHADVVRLIGGGDGRRWLFKNPGHIWALDTLFDVYPDATVIQTHRDPAQAVPSISSTFVPSRLRSTTRIDLGAIGRRELAVWSEAARRALAVRKTRPQAFIDVDQRRLHKDPMGIVRHIYGRLGMALTTAVADRMQDRLRMDPERRHGVHRYDMADFGLDKARIRAEFADYIEAFGLDRPLAA